MGRRRQEEDRPWAGGVGTNPGKAPGARYKHGGSDIYRSKAEGSQRFWYPYQSMFKLPIDSIVVNTSRKQGMKMRESVINAEGRTDKGTNLKCKIERRHESKTNQM